MSISSFLRRSLILVVAATLASCANPTGSGGGSLDLTVVNSTGSALTLEAGDFASAFNSGYTAPYRLSLGTSAAGVSFSLPAATGLNLWKRNTAGVITSYLAEGTGSNARSFKFSVGVHYVLTLYSASYSLSEGSGTTASAPATTPTAPVVTNRVFPAVTRSAFVAGVSNSVVAKDLLVTTGSILSRHTATGWEYRFLAEVNYPLAAGTKPVSSVQARVELLDAAGTALWNSSQMPSSYSNGFVYLDGETTSRYLASGGTYNYSSLHLFPGASAYVNLFVSLPDSTSSTDPLYGFDLNQVKTMRLALTAYDFSNLAIAPVPADLALVAGPSTISSTLWRGTFSTPATSTIWWQLSSYSSRVILRDASLRLVDFAYVDKDPSSSWLVGPGQSSVFTAKIPTDIQGTVTSAIAFVNPDVGIPLAASISSRALGLRPSEIEAREAETWAQTQAALSSKAFVTNLSAGQ